MERTDQLCRAADYVRFFATASSKAPRPISISITSAIVSLESCVDSSLPGSSSNISGPSARLIEPKIQKELAENCSLWTPLRFQLSLPSLERPSTGYHLFDAASLAHCQNFSAARLSRPFVPTMTTEIGFGSGVMCKNFTRFLKL